MNREIKFKAFFEGKIYKVAGINFGGGYSVDKGKTVTLIGETMVFSVDLSSVVLMQFTGKLDANGVEIYEGDIVSCIVRDAEDISNQGNREIIFGQEYGFHTREPNDIGDDRKNTFGLPMTWGGYKPIEVIGNVHINPELVAV